MTDGVFIDRSFKGDPTWAVVWNDQLLPVRFGDEAEAKLHLYGLRSGKVFPSPRLPAGTEPGVALNEGRAV